MCRIRVVLWSRFCIRTVPEMYLPRTNSVANLVKGTSNRICYGVGTGQVRFCCEVGMRLVLSEGELFYAMMRQVNREYYDISLGIILNFFLKQLLKYLGSL